MSEPIRVAVVDDHPRMLESLVAVLSLEDDIDIVGSGGTAAEAIDIASGLKPDIMLLDMNMPGSGFAALARIATTCPDVQVIILTMRDDHDSVGKALSLGARAYVLKGVSSAELTGIIRTVNAGGFFVSKSLTTSLISSLLRRRAN